MQILRKHFRKLIITAVLAMAASAVTFGSSANSYRITASASDGSYTAVSCGSSAGDYVVVWFAGTNTYTYFDTIAGDCPPNTE
jgi:hypothetical protein